MVDAFAPGTGGHEQGNLRAKACRTRAQPSLLALCVLWVGVLFSEDGISALLGVLDVPGGGFHHRDTERTEKNSGSCEFVR